MVTKNSSKLPKWVVPALGFTAALHVVAYFSESMAFRFSVYIGTVLVCLYLLFRVFRWNSADRKAG